jgi:hypothetical protein
MKVFTVGLDQKALPAADAAVIKEGKESPPPVYGSMHVPLPQLPPVPPTVLVKKSRGYKGILLVMLAVFIMAIFALTLSEIAYNRHREENYFRLRWAEMKHRLGYGGHRHHGAFPGRENGPYDGFGYRRFGNADGVFSLSKTKDIMDAPASTTSTSPPTTTTSAEQQESSSNSGESRIIFEPSEQRPPFPASRLFPLFPQSPADASSTAAMRDARLQFLRTVLQKIKQRAEAMGFDGTMQVSVIEVEPPTADEEGKPQGAPLLTNHFTSTSNIGKGLAGLPWAQQQSQQQPQSREGPFSFRPPPPQHQLNGLFFPPRPFIDPKSSAFLDGFGETHQPSLFQQNQFMEQQQQQRAQSHQQPEDQENEIDSSSQQQQQPPSMESNPMAGFSPFGAFRPPQHPINPMSNNWQIVSPHQPPHIQLTRPVPTAFDRWPGSNSGPQEGMSGGINPSLALPPPPPPMSAVDGISGSGGSGMDAGNNPNEPPVPPPVMDSSSPASVSGPSGSASSSSANPSQEVMGEVYGRKFGRLLHDIIANRIEGMHKLNQQLQSPSMGFGGSKLVSN